MVAVAVKTIEIDPGTTIDQACRIALSESWRSRVDVKFEFNGTSVTVSPWMSAIDSLIAADSAFLRRSELNRDTTTDAEHF